MQEGKENSILLACHCLNVCDNLLDCVMEHMNSVDTFCDVFTSFVFLLSFLGVPECPPQGAGIWTAHDFGPGSKSYS